MLKDFLNSPTDGHKVINTGSNINNPAYPQPAHIIGRPTLSSNPAIPGKSGGVPGSHAIIHPAIGTIPENKTTLGDCGWG